MVDTCRIRNMKQYELGRKNLEAVRTYFSTHLCATNVECSKALGLSVFSVGRHVKEIRNDWCGEHAPKETGARGE